MGITANCSKFLAYATTRGVSYHSTLMLGRQVLYVTLPEFKEQMKKFKLTANHLPPSFDGQFAEPLFSALGAITTDSLDYSDFEKATIIHDLNQPVPANLRNRYTALFDGGTLEHVFNFPAAVKNCMDMICTGGHYISITPANNQCGHGFYQFSPELFFSLFDEKHGFKTVLVAAGVDVPGSGIREWYEIANPKEVKKRVTVSNAFPTYLMVIAQKIADTVNISLRPMQSDYELVWTVYDSIHTDKPIGRENKLIHYYRKYAPEAMKSLVRKVTGRTGNVQKEIQGLGIVNPGYFKKIDV